MAYLAYTGEMLEALRSTDPDSAKPLIEQLHELTAKVAAELARIGKCQFGPVSELWDGLAGCSFGPSYEGQPVPEVLADLDDAVEWVTLTDGRTPVSEDEARALGEHAL